MSLEVIQLEAENERLRIENNSLRTTARDYSERYWNLCAEVEQLYRNVCGAVPVRDDAELDGTDGAHPAWWRGHDHAVKVLCQKINGILDGLDLGFGVSSEPWESTRRRMLNLASIEFTIAKRGLPIKSPVLDFSDGKGTTVYPAPEKSKIDGSNAQE